MFLEGAKQVCELHLGRCFTGGVLGLHEGACEIFFETLQVHDLLLKGVLHNEAIDADLPGLPDSMSPIDGLEVPHWVPVMLSKNDGVSTCQSESQTTNCCREYHNPEALICIKLLNQLLTLLG